MSIRQRHPDRTVDIDAAKEALASPLLDVSMLGAKGVLFNITGSNSLSLFEVNAAAEVIKQAVEPGCQTLSSGVAFDTNMTNEIRLTLIAHRFCESGRIKRRGQREGNQPQLKDMKPNEKWIPFFPAAAYNTAGPTNAHPEPGNE